VKETKELTQKVATLYKTVVEPDRDEDFAPRTMKEAVARIGQLIYMANIDTLKQFLVDRNGKGDKPHIIVESPHTDPVFGTEDVIYMPETNQYNQEKIDKVEKREK
jgi:hypothetical protein